MLERKPAAGVGPHGWANNYLFHQPDLENCLRQHLSQFASVRVMTHTALVALNVSPESVTARIDSYGNEADAQEGTGSQQMDTDQPEGYGCGPRSVPLTHEVHAAWVVGCDGARSLVRDHMESGLIDLGLHQEWLVVDVELLEPVNLPAVTVQYCNRIVRSPMSM